MTEIVGLRDALISQIDGCAAGAVARPGTEADAVDGVVPAIVAEPGSPEAVAAVLGWASDHGRSVVVRGGGTKLGWGPPVDAVDVLLSTRALNAVEAHRHGDLTATVQAGAILADVNAALAAHRQWLPLDAPHGERATIGGIVAANDSGPRRQRHGPPRDLIIGMTLARADGVRAKSGGIVVKNVAGYDLARLLTGSFGCLGVILTATFKLAPAAEASRTVQATLSEARQFAQVAAGLLARGATPTAVELAWPPPTMLLRFESIAAVAVQQAEQAAALVRDGGGATVLADADEAAAWRRHEARIFGGGGTIAKLVVLPSDLSATLARLDEAARGLSLDCEVVGRAGLGVLYLRLTGAASAQASLVRGLRGGIPAGRGSVVIRRADRELRSLVDVWGPVGDGLPLMRQVKRRFDPRGILNPGRGPGGL